MLKFAPYAILTALATSNSQRFVKSGVSYSKQSRFGKPDPVRVAGFFLSSFVQGASELFATCSNDSIRVWHTATAKQLLQIEVPNKVCNTIAFLPDGSLILSGW